MRNRLATLLPIAQTKTYFVVGGVVYDYVTFNTTSPEYRQMVAKSDLVVLGSGEIIKNRGIVDVVVLSAELQKLIALGSVAEYDAQGTNPVYFVEVPEDGLPKVIKSLPALRAVSASAVALLG